MEAVCPACRKKFRRVRPELAGKKAQCTCGQTFVLGQAGPSSERAVADAGGDAGSKDRTSESVDLSSAAVFENSYSDLEQILAGRGSTKPLPKLPDAATAAQTKSALLTGKDSSAPAPSTQTRNESISGYGSKGMSVGFVAAVISGSLAVWFSLFLLSSRFSVLEFQPLNVVSQTLHDASRATFGELSISSGLERSFVGLGWAIWIVAAGLLALGVSQLINAFVKLFRRRPLLPGIDGVTGLVAVLLLFMLLSTMFFHLSHMSQLNRDLIQKAGGQVDENTVLGRNLLELQSNHANHSRQFMTSMIVASSIPLFICLLSLSRVYVTLGEADLTPPPRGNP